MASNFWALNVYFEKVNAQHRNWNCSPAETHQSFITPTPKQLHTQDILRSKPLIIISVKLCKCACLWTLNIECVFVAEYAYLTCNSAIILSPSSSSSVMAEAEIRGGVLGLGFVSGGIFGSDWDAGLAGSSSLSYKWFYINILGYVKQRKIY